MSQYDYCRRVSRPVDRSQVFSTKGRFVCAAVAFLLHPPYTMSLWPNSSSKVCDNSMAVVPLRGMESCTCVCSFIETLGVSHIFTTHCQYPAGSPWLQYVQCLAELPVIGPIRYAYTMAREWGVCEPYTREYTECTRSHCLVRGMHHEEYRYGWRTLLKVHIAQCETANLSIL